MRLWRCPDCASFAGQLAVIQAEHDKVLRVYQEQISSLRSQLSDLSEQLQKTLTVTGEERKDLLDRLMAATLPSAVRELRRQPTDSPVQSPSQKISTPQRLHFPGLSPRAAPPTVGVKE